MAVRAVQEPINENPEADMFVLPPRPPQPAVAREDPACEFAGMGGSLLSLEPPRDGPRVINVGVPGPGVKANLWRRSWRDKILPAVVNFAPDLILVSAGFDAHRKDDINFHFVGVREHDYAWLTDQIVQVRRQPLVPAHAVPHCRTMTSDARRFATALATVIVVYSQPMHASCVRCGAVPRCLITSWTLTYR